MTVLFKNEYVSSLSDIKPMKERYFYFLFHSPVRITIYTLFIIVTVLGVIRFVTTGELGRGTIAGAAYLLLLVIYEVYSYRRGMKMWAKQRIETYGEQDISMTYEITEDALIGVSSIGQDIKIPLNSFVKLRQSKNLIFLLTEAKVLYTLHKDSFTVGSTEELILFMQNKGLNVR